MIFCFSIYAFFEPWLSVDHVDDGQWCCHIYEGASLWRIWHHHKHLVPHLLIHAFILMTHQHFKTRPTINIINSNSEGSQSWAQQQQHATHHEHHHQYRKQHTHAADTPKKKIYIVANIQNCWQHFDLYQSPLFLTLYWI